jgi:hypothetical protein
MKALMLGVLEWPRPWALVILAGTRPGRHHPREKPRPWNQVGQEVQLSATPETNVMRRQP